MDEIKNKSVLSVPVFFEEVEDVDTSDGRFTNVKIYLMHTGLNLNNSIFEKEVVEAALPSLEYIPIVGFIEKDKITKEDDFSDHRYIITKDENGVRRKYIGSAYGVIKSSDDNNAHFENRVCDDGSEREFLVVDGVLWNMFEDSSEIMNRDLIKSQSMELYPDGIEGYEDEDGNFHFTRFSFRASCILGQGKEPAMVNSTIEVQFTVSDFVKDIQSELNDKYTAYTNFVKAKKEGGNEVMPSANENKDFALSIMQQFDNIATIVKNHETYTDRWGYQMSRYSLYDIQDNEVIVVDRKQNYQYYGFAFTVNGDEPTIDFTNAVRKKITFENYDDGKSVPEGAFDFGVEIKNIEDTAFAKIEEANKAVETANNAVTEITQEKETAEANYTQVKADYDEMKPKYDQYVADEKARQEAELDAQKDAQFARFETALGVDADFVALKENKANLSIQEIEDKCSVLFARKNLATNFSKSNSGSIVAGVIDNENNDGNGFVVTKYGNIPVSH